jgi:hypothetical protein
MRTIGFATGNSGRDLLPAAHHMNRRSTLTRQWELLKLLPPKSGGITTSELQCQLKEAGYATTKRTIERDLVELSRLFPLQRNNNGTPMAGTGCLEKARSCPASSLAKPSP